MGRRSTSGSPSGTIEFESTEQVGYLLEGMTTSRSDPDVFYQPRLILQVDALCDCPAGIMRDAVCAHLKALLDTLSEQELREWFWKAVTPRGDVSG